MTYQRFDIEIEETTLRKGMNMKKALGALALTLASANAAALPGLDLWAGGYTWATGYNGSVQATASGQPFDLNLDSTLGLKDSDNTVIWAAFEHPIPMIPNVQIKKTDLQTSGAGMLTQDFSFGGETYPANVELNSNINLNHTDFTAYWGLPLPIVTIDFGLNVRKFDGEFMINDGTAVIDAPIPMLFGRVGASLPLTGLEVMAEANYIGFKNTNHMDYQVVVRYTLPVVPVLDINLEAGYRAFELNIDPTDFDGSEDDLNADIDMSGVFLGVSFHL